jgi:8-oxo-dGTP pyrophosphatase MutT (NUDIX family)
MTIKPWKTLGSNYLKDHVRVDRCQVMNGTIVEPLILEYPSWVTILALTEREQVVLIQQYRHGIQSVMWEFPGGAAEPGESALETASRELMEETGFTSERLIEVGKASPNPASHTNQHYSVLALDAKQAGVQDLDDAEEIDIALVPLEEVIAMARRGELPQSLHISTLFFALAYLDRIK